MPKASNVKVHKKLRMAAMFNLIGGSLFLLGGYRFFYLGDFIGAMINSLAGVLFLIAAAGFYFSTNKVKV